MANPVLNDRMLKEAERVPGAPSSSSANSTGWAPPPTGEMQYYPPVSDGPVSEWSTNAMTLNGTLTATAVLMALLLASAAFGWSRTTPQIDPTTGTATVSFPALAMVGVLVGLGIAVFLYFKPRLAPFLTPIYAIAEGFFVGAVSRQYETYYDGIVVQAAGATLAVFVVMLVLYRIEVIKVTSRFRQIVVSATLGVAVFYGICMLVRLFAGADSIRFLSSPSWLGIGFSVLVAGLAAMNLALDFDFIEKGSRAGIEKYYEWYAAFGLLVTIVWLYLELLRLIGKLRSR